MISFVYFDVGGVAVFDFSGNNKWDQLCRELHVTPAKRPAFDAIWSRYSNELCIDRDVESLIPILKTELGIRLPPDYSLLAGFTKRIEPNPAIWPTVHAISHEVPIGLLTNMYHGMFAAIQEAKVLPDAPWGIIIDSSVEGCQKPDRDIFEVAQARAGVPGNQILFVDNSAEHVAAAEAFGWKAFLYDPTNAAQSSRKLLKFYHEIRNA